MAEDQTGIMWMDPEWPYRPLNRGSALAYFEHSPFHDRASNNAAARAQNLDPLNEAVLRCGAAAYVLVTDGIQAQRSAEAPTRQRARKRRQIMGDACSPFLFYKLPSQLPPISPGRCPPTAPIS